MARFPFAWFQVQAGISGADTKNITVTENEIGGLTMDVSIDSVISGITETAADGKAYVWNKQNKLVEDKTAGLVLKVSKTITINPAGGSHHHDASELAQFAGTYTLTVSATSTTNNGADEDSRIRLAKAEADVFGDDAVGAKPAYTVTIAADGSIAIDQGTPDNSPTCTVWVSVKGGASGETYDEDSTVVDTAVSGTLEVSLT